MKDNLHSTCLLLLSLIFIAGLAGLGNASEDPDLYNFSNFEKNKNVTWNKIGSPISDYEIWGYPGKDYNFNTTYNCSLFSKNLTVVFYWDCKGDKSDYTLVPMSDADSHQIDQNKNLSHSNCTNRWDTPGPYYVSVGVFQDNNLVNFSYWVPVNIENNTTITVQNFSMLVDDKWVGYNRSSYKVSNSHNSENNSTEDNSKYCGYLKTVSSFSAIINATSLGIKDNRTIDETTTVVYWGDNNSDNSILGSGNRTTKPVDKGTNYIEWDENFTHEWNEIGEKNISVRTFHWDPLDGNEMYTNYTNTSILIIKDPKNFISIPIFSNLQNWGIFLVATGLMILFFTYTKNNVPIEISLFGLKPLRLKSVDTFAGIFAFVAGMYLYFVFGRCPWDIPIVGNIDLFDWLADVYFGVLYYEYVTKQFSGIPYLSILLGLAIVFALSLAIYLVGSPAFKGKLKPGKRPGEKDSSTPVQPEPDPHPIEKRMNLEELTALIEKEKDPVILQQLYFVRFRYLGESVEKAASMRGISVGKALNLQELWKESGYEGFRNERFRSERKGENISLQELTTLIENEKDTRVLRALYFIRLRDLRNSVETAASRLGISEETGQLLEKIWKDSGYEGLRELELEGKGS